MQEEVQYQNTEIIRDIWDQFADVYSSTLELKSNTAATKGFMKALTHLNKKENISLVEVACGSGIFGEFLLNNHADMFSKVRLFDLSNTMIQKCKNRLKNQNKIMDLEISVQNCENLYFLEKNSFDLVIGSLVFHLVDNVKNALNCA